MRRSNYNGGGARLPMRPTNMSGSSNTPQNIPVPAIRSSVNTMVMPQTQQTQQPTPITRVNRQLDMTNPFSGPKPAQTETPAQHPIRDRYHRMPIPTVIHSSTANSHFVDNGGVAPLYTPASQYYARRVR